MTDPLQQFKVTLVPVEILHESLGAWTDEFSVKPLKVSPKYL